MNDLDARLLAAHAAGDGRALVALYTEAATARAGSEAHWFYLTQAYVWALDIGAPEAAALRQRLALAGREE